MRRAVLLVSLLVVAACARERVNPMLASGEHRLAVHGGSIWYKVTNLSNGHRAAVVLLHGGPGFNSFYLKPLEDLADDRPVIRYDQLGAGKSDTTSDTTMFNIAHFVAELDSLRAHLGVERWHVYGHSWGTILALEYYRAHPDRVLSLGFGSPVFDLPAFETYVRGLLPTLSDSAQRAIRRGEATQTYDSPSYQNAFNEFIGLYVTRHPVPADMESTFTTVNQGIYMYMQGPSEFTIVGTLKLYKVTDFLPSIGVPALLTVGEFDEVGPDLVRSHAALIPGARFELIPGAGHLTSWDNREVNTRVVREFLRGADSSVATR